jgi:hypothetical protein
LSELKIEHFENDIQMRTYLITEKDGAQDICYEEDGDYKAIRHLQQRIAELEAQSQWTLGRPPFEAKRVLGLLENNLVVIANLVDNSASKFPYVGWQYEGMHPGNIKIKGWQHLPQPAKEQAQ